ncbi:MAG: hypothetical protein FWG79_01545 [Bacteroidales bacterium]|nr:hypothetical protein [Bacteroidales bacterium]
MKTLKNYVKMLTIATILAAGPGVKGQEVVEGPTREEWLANLKKAPASEFTLTPEFKATAKLGKVDLFGAVGVAVRPKPAGFYVHGNDLNEFYSFGGEIPQSTISLSTGVEIGNKNKLKAKAQLDGIGNKKYTNLGVSVGYLREQKLSDAVKLSLYIGAGFKNSSNITIPLISYSRITSGPYIPQWPNIKLGLSGIYGPELHLEYERKIGKSLSLFANAGYNYRLNNDESYGNTDIFKDYSRPAHLFSANVGLHLDLRPESPFTPRQRSAKVRAAKPQKRKVSNTVPCYAYPQQRGSESKIFNRPNEMR